MTLLRHGILLLLSACNTPAPEFITPCGLLVMSGSGWPQGEVQRLEKAVVRQLPRASDSRFAYTCQAIRNTTVEVQPTESWPDAYGRGQISGLAICQQGRVLVGAAPTPFDSALAHELAHIVQNCDPWVSRGPEDRDDMHAGWFRLGIYAAIDRARSER